MQLSDVTRRCYNFPTQVAVGDAGYHIFQALYTIRIDWDLDTVVHTLDIPNIRIEELDF
jgi:hypothetical protein